MAEGQERRARQPERSRLLDIVVEEVSLVDRAANEHRFLIVKRSDAAMPNTQDDASVESAAPDDAAAPTEVEQAEEALATPVLPTGSLLATAVSALEGLTSTVELLGSMGADQADTRLAPLALELKATAEALLSQAGGGMSVPPAGGEEDEDTEPSGESDSAKDGAAFTQHLTSARAVLTQLATLAEAAETPAADQPAPQTDPAPLIGITDALAALNDSFRTLADTVKEQHRRLARVEKQFGLPNSAPTREQLHKAEPEQIGWPLDLNNPMDREHVDKAVSFYEP